MDSRRQRDRAATPPGEIFGGVSELSSGKPRPYLAKGYRRTGAGFYLRHGVAGLRHQARIRNRRRHAHRARSHGSSGRQEHCNTGIPVSGRRHLHPPRRGGGIPKGGGLQSRAGCWRHAFPVAKLELGALTDTVTVVANALRVQNMDAQITRRITLQDIEVDGRETPGRLRFAGRPILQADAGVAVTGIVRSMKISKKNGKATDCFPPVPAPYQVGGQRKRAIRFRPAKESKIPWESVTVPVKSSAPCRRSVARSIPQGPPPNCSPR